MVVPFYHWLIDAIVCLILWVQESNHVDKKSMSRSFSILYYLVLLSLEKKNFTDVLDGKVQIISANSTEYVLFDKICFIWFDSLRPSQHFFSARSGRVYHC